MKGSNVIIDTVTRLLLERGFVRAGTTFYQDLQELTAVVTCSGLSSGRSTT